MADDENDRTPEENERLKHFLRGMEYERKKAAKEAEKERQKPILRTPQDIRGATKAGGKWLRKPAQAAIYEANQLAHHFFYIASVLMDPTAKEHHAKWETRVFDARHRLALILDASPTQRRKQQLAVFFREFREQIAHCERSRKTYLAPVDPAGLSSNPDLAALRKEELETRGEKLARKAFGSHAHMAISYFSRIYPDDGAKLDHRKLSAALRSAIELRARGKQGRRKKGDPGLYRLLSEAISRTTFALSETAIKSAWEASGEKQKKYAS